MGNRRRNTCRPESFSSQACPPHQSALFSPSRWRTQCRHADSAPAFGPGDRHSSSAGPRDLSAVPRDLVRVDTLTLNASAETAQSRDATTLLISVDEALSGRTVTLNA